MTERTPELARCRARLGALAVHARHDPRQTTAAARARFLHRFEVEVDATDPEGQLDQVERARRITYAKRLYFARLAYRSQIARAARARARQLADRPWLAAGIDEAASAEDSDDGRR